MINKSLKRVPKDILELGLAILISFLLASLSTSLFKQNSRISGANYLGLVMISVFAGIVVYFRKSIREIDVKNMRVILEKTQKVKGQIENIAFDLARIISQLSAYSSGSWVNRKKLNDDIEALLDRLKISVGEKKKILKLPRTIEKLMKDKRSLTKKENKMVEEMFKIEDVPPRVKQP